MKTIKKTIVFFNQHRVQLNQQSRWCLSLLTLLPSFLTFQHFFLSFSPEPINQLGTAYLVLMYFTLFKSWNWFPFWWHSIKREVTWYNITLCHSVDWKLIKRSDKVTEWLSIQLSFNYEFQSPFSWLNCFIRWLSLVFSSPKLKA